MGTLTDQNALSGIQQKLGEPEDGGATWASELWTPDEVIAYLKQRQERFLKDTGMVLTRGTVATTATNRRFALPSDWIVTRRVAWKSATGTYQELPRGDMWEADMGVNTWPNTDATKPAIYDDGDQPSLAFSIMPASTVNGTAEFLYVAIPTAPSNTGVTMAVPDEWLQTVVYGAIEDMLSKVGRGQDLQRAAYAGQMWAEGIATAKAAMGGWL